MTQGASVWNYRYDYLGRRIEKSGTGIATTRYLYDGWNLIAELDGSGSVTRRFVWGLDVSGTLQGAGGVGGLLAIDDGGSQYFPVYDASHNVIGLYDGTGTTVAAYEYDPFGNLQTMSAGGYAAANPFRFSTKYTDTETGTDTGLVDYGMRFYSPALGRFVNRDPIGEAGGINLYAFCGNDGVNRYDMLGMEDPGSTQLAPITVTATYPSPFTSSLWSSGDHSDPTGQYLGAELNGSQQPPSQFDYKLGSALQLNLSGPAANAQAQSIAANFQLRVQSAIAMHLFWARYGSVGPNNAAGTSTFQNDVNLLKAGVTLAGRIIQQDPVTSMIAQIFLARLMPVAGEVPAAIGAEGRMVTVLGSGRDVAPYAGKAGFNVLDMSGVPEAEWARTNAEWLNTAFRRGDDIWLVTDPAQHAQLMQQLGKSSYYLDLELPMLEQFNATGIPKFSTPPPPPPPPTTLVPPIN